MEGPLTSCDLSNVDLDARLGAPVVPPAEWLLKKPAWAAAGMDPTVDTCNEVGRGFGYVAAWSSRFLNHHPLLQSARQLKQADTSYFNRRPMPALDADGKQVAVQAGVIGMGHSPDTLTTIEEIQDFHDTPGRAKLIARYDSDDFGPYVNFVVVPEATWLDVVQIQRSAFSGEWFPLTHSIETGERLIRPVWAVVAPAIVSHPAMPLPVSERSIGPGGVLVAAGVSSVRSGYGTTMVDEPSTPMELTMSGDADKIVVNGDTFEKVTAAMDGEADEGASVEESGPSVDVERVEVLESIVADMAVSLAEVQTMVADLTTQGTPDEVPLDEA